MVAPKPNAWELRESRPVSGKGTYNFEAELYMDTLPTVEDEAST